RLQLIDDELTQFVRLVKSAQLELVDGVVAEQEGKILIVKKTVDNPFVEVVEGEPSRCLCVLTLPIEVPGLRGQPCSSQLFMLERDLQAIQVLAQQRVNVAVGNPGIGKSVLLWKIIVLLLKPGLWSVLRDIFNSA